MEWLYQIKGYYSQEAHWPRQPDGLAITVCLASETSRDTEIEVFKYRAQRGEIGRIEVVNLKPPYKLVEITAAQLKKYRIGVNSLGLINVDQKWKSN